MSPRLVAIALVLAIILTIVSIAQRARGETRDHDILPPAEYDHPFNGEVVETRADEMSEMENYCFPNPQAKIALGCAVRVRLTPTAEQLRCYIFLAPPDYLKRWNVTADAVRRHEIAHCNGWRHDHPR